MSCIIENCEMESSKMQVEGFLGSSFEMCESHIEEMRKLRTMMNLLIGGRAVVHDFRVGKQR